MTSSVMGALACLAVRRGSDSELLRTERVPVTTRVSPGAVGRRDQVVYPCGRNVPENILVGDLVLAHVRQHELLNTADASALGPA